MDEAGKRTHARKLNMARRHLNQEQRAALWVDMRKDGMSYRQIAETDKTASKDTIKRAVENSGVSFDTPAVTGKDGKQYPAKQVPRKPAPELPLNRPISISVGISFDVFELDVFDRQAAINWIINNQLGRRNLHPDQASYLRGKRYNGEKQAQGGTGANQHAQSSQNDNSAKTHERLATEYKVSPATITRDGQYAASVDALARVAVS